MKMSRKNLNSHCYPIAGKSWKVEDMKIKIKITLYMSVLCQWCIQQTRLKNGIDESTLRNCFSSSRTNETWFLTDVCLLCLHTCLLCLCTSNSQDNPAGQETVPFVAISKLYAQYLMHYCYELDWQMNSVHFSFKSSLSPIPAPDFHKLLRCSHLFHFTGISLILTSCTFYFIRK